MARPLTKTDTHTLYTKVYYSGYVVTFWGFGHVKKSREYIVNLKG